jgi:hypothetical protein
MIIKARDISTDHIGRAVSIPYHINAPTFVLNAFNTILIQPNPWMGSGRVDLLDRQGRWHSIDPDSQLIVEP